MNAFAAVGDRADAFRCPCGSLDCRGGKRYRHHCCRTPAARADRRPIGGRRTPIARRTVAILHRIGVRFGQRNPATGNEIVANPPVDGLHAAAAGICHAPASALMLTEVDASA